MHLRLAFLRPATSLVLAALTLCTAVRASAELASSPPLPSWALGPFARPADAQPIIRPNPASRFHCPLRNEPVAWEARHTFNPAAIVRDGQIHVLYRAEDDSGRGIIGSYTSRLGLATSPDGLAFTTEPEPVFFPAPDAQQSVEWTGGCEDPRIVESPDGTYVLTYTQFGGIDPTTGRLRKWSIGVATSRDLHTWTKHGDAFTGTPFERIRMKSAGIVQELRDDRLVAARIEGKFWMYFGEQAVHVAHSTDLIRWTPVAAPDGNLLAVMRPRPGFFDSQLTEVGPPPILTTSGIVLIYNAKNHDQAAQADPTFARGVYTCSQALFSSTDPTALQARMDHPFFQPALPWEKSGQYGAGTTFAQGLVHHQGRWFLYYGCADTYVGVAVSP
jgi:beta-1,2-mannosidase